MTSNQTINLKNAPIRAQTVGILRKIAICSVSLLTKSPFLLLSRAWILRLRLCHTPYFLEKRGF
jgi:hypothetical protein